MTQLVIFTACLNTDQKKNIKRGANKSTPDSQSMRDLRRSLEELAETAPTTNPTLQSVHLTIPLLLGPDVLPNDKVCKSIERQALRNTVKAGILRFARKMSKVTDRFKRARTDLHWVIEEHFSAKGTFHGPFQEHVFLDGTRHFIDQTPEDDWMRHLEEPISRLWGDVDYCAVDEEMGGMDDH
jgi:hypothetical protein